MEHGAPNSAPLRVTSFVRVTISGNVNVPHNVSHYQSRKTEKQCELLDYARSPRSGLYLFYKNILIILLTNYKYDVIISLLLKKKGRSKSCKRYF